MPRYHGHLTASNSPSLINDSPVAASSGIFLLDKDTLQSRRITARYQERLRTVVLTNQPFSSDGKTNRICQVVYDGG